MKQIIVNEVELKKEAREKEKAETLKRKGKKEELKIDDEKKKEVVLCKTTTDVQKRKLDKLMSHPTKEVYIPEPRKEWKPREAPEFVRHVMGSSAGAGSGEFHVYRGIRRRENKRQEYMDKKSVKDELDGQFHEIIEQNQKQTEDVTTKKRLKRQRKKEKKLLAKKLKKVSKNVAEVEEEEDEEQEDDIDDDHENEESHFVIGRK